MSPLVSGRKPRVPRLEDIDPARVAAQVCERLVASLSESAAALEVALPTDCLSTAPAELAQSTQVGRDMVDLVRWAQAGVGDEEAVYHLLLGLYPRIYGRPADAGAMPPLDEIDIEPIDEVSSVVIAAIARFNMRTGKDVDIRGLAALASISYHRIRHLSASGGLVRSGRGRVSADEARRFLQARCVPV
jgi:hypothetical protein